MKKFNRINVSYLGFVLFLILAYATTGAYAANIEAKLADSAGANAFQVQDKDGVVLMHVKSDGNVGIGTSNPGYKLDVAGSIEIPADEALRGGGFPMISYTDGNSDGNRDICIGCGSPRDIVIRGNKMDVYGPIWQRGSLLHADYVFEPNYKLESIEEHAEYMWNNKHLSAVPKATADKNGLEVLEMGSHRRGMLEELEKAHIYIQQLSTTVKDQKKMIIALRALLCKDHPAEDICR